MLTGVPEVMMFLFIAVLNLIPLAVAIWALLTLNRMRGTQEAMRGSLERIERLLQRS